MNLIKPVNLLVIFLYLKNILEFLERKIVLLCIIQRLVFL